MRSSPCLDSALPSARLAWLLPLMLFFCEAARAVEEPPFSVIASEPPFELRRYPAFVVAQTQQGGDFDAASRTGFRLIASYIFGDNRQDSGGKRKISMTAPVTVTPADQGWQVHFVMPANESLQSLPQPLNSHIQLRQVPAHEVAAVRFSGFTTQASMQAQTARLRAWAQAKQLKLSPTAQVARYDNPFTLPWNRRNEILINLLP